MSVSEMNSAKMDMAVELTKEQIKRAATIIDETGLIHNSENVIQTAQVLATNLLYIATNAIT